MANYVSLFTGAGGLDLGLERAGWEGLYATDWDTDAIATLEANQGREIGPRRKAFSGTVIEQADIRSLTGKHILERVGRSAGSITLLAGGPPCQSWSSAGHQLGFDDPRGKLVGDYLRIASELDARWLLFENVRGLLTARGRDGQPGSALTEVRQELLRRGWQTRVELLNAADYGVPQRRVRLILIGFRAGDAPVLPSPTHSSKHSLDGLQPWVTLRDCLANIAPVSAEEIIRPTGKLAEQLASIPEGSGVKSPGKAEATRPGGHWGYKQGAFVTDPGLPARTVTASSQQDWFRDPRHGLRRLCPRECAALQTFPDDWTFCGKRADHYRLIGNAVPPLLAEVLGQMLLADVERTATKTNTAWTDLHPLPSRLSSAIAYTRREELRNGPSRRSVGVRRSAIAATRG